MKNYFSEKQIQDAKDALKEEKCADTFKRLQALNWHIQGVAETEIIEKSGFSHSSIKRFRRNFKKQGVDGLRNKYIGGNNRYLTRAREAEILKELTESAKTGTFVRVKELKTKFEKAAGVTYHLHPFYRVLERNGWRAVVPRPQHPKKSSDEAIEASKKLTLL